MDKFDVIVVGLGTMGAAAALTLADRGQKVLGFDAYRPPHPLGSHHGESRIIRKAYYEHPSYVPLIERSYALWSALETRANSRLMTKTGGLMIGQPESGLVSGALQSARQHKLPHAFLSQQDMRDRFPVFQLDAGMVAVHEPDAGILYPEQCVQTFLNLAALRGATLRFGEAVRSWQSTGDGISVVTEQATYRAAKLVLAAGAWLGPLAPALQSKLTIERQVVLHIEPREQAPLFRPDRLPIFCLEEANGGFFYGIPDLGNGLKVGQHYAGPRHTRADAVDRTVHARDVEIVRDYLARRMPAGNGQLASSLVCLYTDTPDLHFALDYYPSHDNVVVASVCSGHGFKFAPVVGEVIADLISGKRPAFDLSLFGARRLVA
jgi:sarcosine oxidase